MTLLCDLCVKYGTDKGPRSMNGWGYSPFYYEKLEAKRKDVFAVLEIGICGHRDIPNNVIGASLWVWHDFFPNATIVGIDNDPRWMVNEGRIVSYCLDAYDTRDLTELMNSLAQPFDFIVDDAVHDPPQQIQLINDLWPYLEDNGLYAVEDVCPYKLPDGELEHLINNFPLGTVTKVITTHKDERLLLVENK